MNSHPLRLRGFLQALFSYHVPLLCLSSTFCPQKSHNVLRDTHTHTHTHTSLSPPGRTLFPPKTRIFLEEFQPLFASRCPLFPGRGRSTLPPEPLMVLTMHSSPVNYIAGITTPQKQLPNILFFALPQQSLGSPSEIDPCANNPPHTP